MPLAVGRVEESTTGYGESGYGGIEDDEDGNDGTNDESVVPSVSTDSATDVTDSSATLHGTVTNLGSADAVDGYFEVRNGDLSAGSATETRRLTAEDPYSVTVEDLSSDMSYQYRALAASDHATGAGETLSFVTEPGEIGKPVIEELSLTDTSGPNPYVDLEVNWSVSHSDGALEEARLIVHGNGKLIDDSTIRITGSGYSGSETFKVNHGAGRSYFVALVITDRVGNTITENATISA